MSAYSEELHQNPLPYEVWGREQIDEASLKQMDAAMRLPITLAGALMPDAHVGYGLPIGGVLATDGAVIPYAVGVDIACRMRLSVFSMSSNVLGQQPGKFENALNDGTVFGAGKTWPVQNRPQHEVLDDPAWEATGFLNSLKDAAYGQLGTSGSGNHFVNWGEFALEEDDQQLGLEAGRYLAMLSHSGSRGVGFQIANRYSDLAMKQHPHLDKSVQHLAWLPLDSQLGQEYWVSMELAGRFAAANHEVLHRLVAKAAGMKPVVSIENHHNFAWKERIPAPPGFNEPEREVVVHRKGATPAGKGVLGIIPGSMGDPGFVVRGKGNVGAIYSASHGAGRKLSRRAANNAITKTERDKYLKERGVKLIGGGMDESPQAYKDIHEVMEAQSDLVEIVGKFTPRIVRMDSNEKMRGKGKNKRKK